MSSAHSASKPRAIHTSVAAAETERRVHIIQGGQHVESSSPAVLITILGSCVAACMHDPITGIGGMNHFLLPGDREGEAVRHGVHAMELLVNGLLREGARRERLQAKLFGGARMVRGLTDVGEMNAAFAENFLAREGIAHAGGSLRGDRGRRIQFWPMTGRARQAFIGASEPSAFEQERAPPPPPQAFGSMELF